MRIYTVHIHHGNRDPDRNLVLVKEGFGWPAFLFSGLWALWHRMWFWAAVLIGAGFALGLLLAVLGVGEVSHAAITFGFAIVVGFIGNDLRRRSLAYKGYREFGVVAGDDLSAAERRFFDESPHWVAAFRS